MDKSEINNSIMGEKIRSVFGNEVNVCRVRSVPGGDINAAYALELTDGTGLFLKCNSASNAAFFDAEINGLKAIAETKTISVPEPICSGTYGDRSYLLMSMIESGREIKGYWECFGHDLARMHKADASDFVSGGKYGFWRDNFIGAGKQKNTPCDTWIEFFREQRLKPQVDLAVRYFDAALIKRIERLYDKLDDLLTEPEKPALLHGDLWSGNFITGPDGRAWLIDPAVYVGHPEADIAMTQLFGGFARPFYDAYREEGLLGYGYDDRRDIYNLYHMLNHLNLFGSGYLSSVISIIDRYV